MTGFTTNDPAFLELLRVAERAASSQASILLLGETGTGKNRMARFVHERSSRASGPFVEVACANISDELFESEIFGHDQGAFTDANSDRVGRLEQADGGTIFLDEIQELSLPSQAKLLRAIEERRFERVGGRETREVDVRVLASTRERPARLVESGRLRDDLLYRLDVIRLELPPLRARRGDLARIAEELLAEAIQRHGLPPRRLAASTLLRLQAQSWQGNVRELLHVVERAAILATADTIEPEDLPDSPSVSASAALADAASREATLGEVERAYIEEILRKTDGNKTAAARILGIHRKTLHEKLRGYGKGDGAS